VCTWDMLESPAEWFYAAEYISSVSLEFQHPRRRIVACL